MVLVESAWGQNTAIERSMSRSHRKTSAGPKRSEESLVITATPEGRTIRHRPLPKIDLPRVDPLEGAPSDCPFGLQGASRDLPRWDSALLR